MKLKHEFPPEFFEESTATFEVDRERKRLWAALLDLLAEFDRVCRKHNIKYSIDGGTMLGKARHNGFIPWDDDIDVIIMRSEYEKLKKIASDEFKHPYFFQTMESDPEACRGHPQLRNSSMTMILKGEFKDGKALWKTFNQGLFMDIFVLDSIPDDVDERVRYFEELTRLRNRIFVARKWRHEKLSFGIKSWELYKFYCGFRERRKLAKVRNQTGMDPLVWYQQQFARACRRYEGSGMSSVSHIGFDPSPRPSCIFKRESVNATVDVDFMGVKVMMLRDWKYYLENLYGDWHKYVIGGACHGGIVVDLDNPYTRYF